MALTKSPQNLEKAALEVAPIITNDCSESCELIEPIKRFDIELKRFHLFISQPEVVTRGCVFLWNNGKIICE